MHTSGNLVLHRFHAHRSSVISISLRIRVWSYTIEVGNQIDHGSTLYLLDFLPHNSQIDIRAPVSQTPCRTSSRTTSFQLLCTM